MAKVNIQGRLSYPALFKASAFEGQEPKYSAHILVAADSPALAKLRAAMQEAAEAKWGAKAPAMLKGLIANGKVCVRDGSTKAGCDGYEGNWFVSAASRKRPLVIDRDKSPLTEADGKPYAGCIVNAVIEIWAQDNNFGKRLNAELKGVQFVKDGPAFGGSAPASADDFDDLSDLGDGASDDDFEDLL